MNETTVAGATGATHSGEEQAAAAPASETVRPEGREDLRCFACGRSFGLPGGMLFGIEGLRKDVGFCRDCLAEPPEARFERLEAIRQDRDDAMKAVASSRLAEERAVREARETVEECRERAAERDEAIRERDDAREELRKMTGARDYFRDNFRDMRAVCESLRLELATACAECDEASKLADALQVSLDAARADRDKAIRERDQARATFALSDASEVAARLAETEEQLRITRGAREFWKSLCELARADCEELRLKWETACAERDAAISASGAAIIEAQQARRERDGWEARFRGWAQDLEIAARAARLGGGPA